jgi:hypothetical protein
MQLKGLKNMPVEELKRLIETEQNSRDVRRKCRDSIRADLAVYFGTDESAANALIKCARAFDWQSNVDSLSTEIREIAAIQDEIEQLEAEVTRREDASRIVHKPAVTE